MTINYMFSHQCDSEMAQKANSTISKS